MMIERNPLRRWMDERDLSTRELGRRSGLHWTTISHVAVGSRRPNHDTARKLAEALDIEERDVLDAYDLP